MTKKMPLDPKHSIILISDSLGQLGAKDSFGTSMFSQAPNLKRFAAEWVILENFLENLDSEKLKFLLS